MRFRLFFLLALLSTPALAQTVSIDDVTVAEGQPAVFRVTLSAPLLYPYTVNYSTTDRSAKAGRDYKSNSGTITMPALTTQKTIIVPTFDDSEFEGNETFEVHLFLSSAAVPIAKGIGVCTIVSDDAVFHATESAEAPSTFAITLEFVRTSPSAETVSLASNDATIVTVPATMNVPPNTLWLDIPVNAHGGGRATITATIPASLGAPQASVTIWITRPGAIAFSSSGASVPQGRSVEVSLSMTPPQTEPIAVSLQSSNPSAVDIPLSVTIPPGNPGKLTIFGKTRGTTTTITATLSQTYASRTALLPVTVSDPIPNLSISRVSPNTGATAGGTDVTITGAALNANCTIAFGGRNAATPTIVNATTMQLRTPPHAAGVVPISIRCDDNQTATLTNAFTYVAQAPTIGTAAPTFGSIAGGTIVRLSGSNFLDSCGITFNGVFGTDVVLESPTSMLVAAPKSLIGKAALGVACVTGLAALQEGFIFTDAEEPTASLTGLDRTEAAPGQTLMLKGTRFRASDRVTIGHTLATILRTTPEAHFVRVPDIAPGTVAVTLRDVNGRETTTGPIFAVLPAVTPQIQNVTVSGNEIEIIGNGFVPAQEFFLDDVALRVVSLDFTRVVARAPFGTFGTFMPRIVRNGATVASGSAVAMTSSVALTAVNPRCAAFDGGAIVTINGSGFVSGTKVTFDDVDATSVTIAGPTTLTAAIPAGDVGAATVIVTTPSGARAALTDGFAYTSRFQPDSGCGGKQRAVR